MTQTEGRGAQAEQDDGPRRDLLKVIIFHYSKATTATAGDRPEEEEGMGFESLTTVRIYTDSHTGHKRVETDYGWGRSGITENCYLILFLPHSH